MILRQLIRKVLPKTQTASERSDWMVSPSLISSTLDEQPNAESPESSKFIKDVVTVCDDFEALQLSESRGLSSQSINISDDEMGSAPSTHSAPNGTDIISHIPAEVLMDIIDFLPLSSAAILSICSRHMLSKLGKGHIKSINRGKGFKIPHIYSGKMANYGEEIEARMMVLELERQKFLLLLQKQLPEEIFCFHCQIIHSPDKTDADTSGKKTAPKRPCFQANRAHNTHHRGFSFSQVQMAMKRHHLRLDPGAQLEKLSSTSDPKLKSDHTYLLTSTARIISDSLWLRSQHWIVLPSNKLLWPKLHHRIPVCCHWTDNHSIENQEDPIACRISHKLKGSCEYCVEMHSCDKCNTEIQINSKKLKKGYALVITVWKKLGDGETPFDPTWMSHWENLWHSNYTEFGFSEPGRIKRIFEDGKPFVFDAHLPEETQEALRANYTVPPRTDYRIPGR